MSERSMGFLLCLLSIVIIVVYTWILFLSPTDWEIMDKQLSWWALAIPVYIIVLIFWAILIWIGWAMATTKAPPTPMSEEKKEKG